MAKKKEEPEEQEIDESVLEHIIIPEHIKLSDKEVEEVIERFNISPHSLPLIDISDPAIQHLDPKVGEIIKIKRRSNTAGETFFFRRVIHE